MVKRNKNSEPLIRRCSLFSFLPQTMGANAAMSRRQTSPSTDFGALHNRARGFTLIELVMVLVLVGVLAVFAVPRMFNRNDFDARAFHDRTLAYLRYAQKTAIAQRRVVCVAFTLTTVTLSRATAAGNNVCNTPLSGPDGKAMLNVEPPAIVTFAAVPVGFYFDGLGQPLTSVNAPAPRNIQVVNVQRSITVESGTGYVHD
jgi:MSHA pilin protein MshC